MNPKFSDRAAADHNERAWDSLAKQGQRFTKAAKDDEFKNPLQILDGNNWLGGNISGQKLLCLAAGGGRQGPLYAAAGADVTVVDISATQLELDRVVAQERQLRIKTVKTSMDDLSMFAIGEFDIVIHPVATCYLPNIEGVFQQVAKVTRSGGLYISQHKQPTSLQTDVHPQGQSYPIVEPYYRTEPLNDVAGSLHREEGTLEFLHRWEQIIGGQCRAGFVIEDLVEPFHADSTARPGTFAHRSHFAAPYVRIKARRRESSKDKSSSVWLPGH